MRKPVAAFCLALLAASPLSAQEEHRDHPMPEHLGTVHFATSCAAMAQPAFDRAVALLHSFTYEAADAAFADVLHHDPSCAMAHWGRAMTHYHQLWDVPAGAGLKAGAEEIGQAAATPTGTARERALIAALGLYYAQADAIPAATRAKLYSEAMIRVAQAFPQDDEIAIFAALSLIATAPPNDRGHTRQKRAADILEPIWKRQPDHPGVPHYLIHAYDSAELAQRGLPAARAYAKIAPSAPHALHMPSHIFTRLGLWDDSITSNIAARDAALAQHDPGEALHAMDYLAYAYLQRGEVARAAEQLRRYRSMNTPFGTGFKVSYVANALPARLAIETGDWATAARLTPMPGSGPQVAAITWWARALGKLRGESPQPADADIAKLEECRDALRAAKDDYWAAQTDALLKSAGAWQAAARNDGAAAIATMTAAADQEDALEKLPLTPGPIVPAREQLGELLLRFHHPREALAAFNAALALAPGRAGALRGKAASARAI